MKINGNNTESFTIENKNLKNIPIENPLRKDAFAFDDEVKIQLIRQKFEEILHIIGLDLKDDSIKETPNRIAKMYINEVFSGLNPKNRPNITLFKNTYKYDSPLIELNIPFTSFCEHHFVPIVGIANIAYIPNEYVIGLSKLHRLTNFYAKRPQVQERLTKQIHQDLKNLLKTENIGVVLKATHSCISCRGVEDSGSSTISSAISGKIKDDVVANSKLFGL